MQRDIGLGHHADATSLSVYDGNPADLVLLHQLFTVFQCVFRRACDWDACHEFCHPSGFGKLRVRDDRATQIAVGYDDSRPMPQRR